MKATMVNWKRRIWQRFESVASAAGWNARVACRRRWAAYAAVLLLATLASGGCRAITGPAEPGQTTTRPTDYYVGQIRYWQDVADRIALLWSDPASPMPESVKNELAAARWWVRFFSESLAMVADPGTAAAPPATRALRGPAK